jgi:surface antigen
VTTFGARSWYRPVLAAGEATRLATAGLLVLGTGACSMALPIASLVDEPATTSSVAAKAVSPLSPDLGTEDWRRAKAALAVALDPQGSGAQVSWDNPETRLKGTFTPVAQPFVKNDEICRAFIAQITGQAIASSLHGTACRPSGGEWSITEVKPAPRAAPPVGRGALPR